jgi:hypothetical protein
LCSAPLPGHRLMNIGGPDLHVVPVEIKSSHEQG